MFDYDDYDSCRDGCGCDMFCRIEMIERDLRRKEMPQKTYTQKYGIYDPPSRAPYYVPAKDLTQKTKEKQMATKDEKYTKGRIKCVNKNKDRKLVKLADLVSGDTFRFHAGVNSSNVYMVIGSHADLTRTPDEIHYVLLGSGGMYSSHHDKEVVRVSCELTYEDMTP